MCRIVRPFQTSTSGRSCPAQGHTLRLDSEWLNENVPFCLGIHGVPLQPRNPPHIDCNSVSPECFQHWSFKSDATAHQRAKCSLGARSTSGSRYFAISDPSLLWLCVSYTPTRQRVRAKMHHRLHCLRPTRRQP